MKICLTTQKNHPDRHDNHPCFLLAFSGNCFHFRTLAELWRHQVVTMTPSSLQVLSKKATKRRGFFFAALHSFSSKAEHQRQKEYVAVTPPKSLPRAPSCTTCYTFKFLFPSGLEVHGAKPLPCEEVVFFFLTTYDNKNKPDFHLQDYQLLVVSLQLILVLTTQNLLMLPEPSISKIVC